MAMTRRQRFQRDRDREKIKHIGGEGLTVAVPEEAKCDECREPAGTLYEIEGRLLCIRHVPIKLSGTTLVRKAVSGRENIIKKRRTLGQ
jgi:hypothetical protein